MKEKSIGRRDFIKAAGIGTASIVLWPHLMKCSAKKHSISRQPNLVYILADQWRAQASGYSGDRNAKTPNLDKLAKESINFSNAVSCCPVCSPYRASLITGRYPLTHGVFVNDVRLNTEAASIAQAYKNAGYKTAYIGKWHLDGRGRSDFIPQERRQGFEFWKAMECTHNYNDSFYYADENIKLKWEFYDAIAQTDEAERYIREHADGRFALVLSWGPPHPPYNTAPDKYKKLFKQEDIVPRPNIPPSCGKQARVDLAGYYAHIAALDDCAGRIISTLKECGLEQDTILVFTSDHGDMLYSLNHHSKQRPWDESIRVPFLLRYPAMHGKKGRTIDMPINTPDIMPTLLALSGVDIPATVEGTDFSGVIRGEEKAGDNAALIMCPWPFGEWLRKEGGREFRGIRTRRYTYAKDLNGSWLLYDNQTDPYQLNNLCGNSKYAKLQSRLENILMQKLHKTNDEFLSGWEYIKKWRYEVDENGTVPYSN